MPLLSGIAAGHRTRADLLAYLGTNRTQGASGSIGFDPTPGTRSRQPVPTWNAPAGPVVWSVHPPVCRRVIGCVGGC
jgi:hypothetical protein